MIGAVLCTQAGVLRYVDLSTDDDMGVDLAVTVAYNDFSTPTSGSGVHTYVWWWYRENLLKHAFYIGR